MAWSGRFDDFRNYTSTSISNTNQDRRSGTSSTALSSDSSVKICDITADIPSVNVIGAILTKDGPKSIISKKGSGSERFLVSFTVRDSPDAFINCTCWGNEDFINNVSRSVNIGDIIELRNAQVQIKPMNQTDDRYKPWTPSGFQLNLSENHSNIETYTGWDVSSYSGLHHLPTKPSNDFYTLEDVNVNSTALQGEHVNLLVAIKQVWPTRNITTKIGKKTRKCDVVLCDETCSNFILTLWENHVDLAMSWAPRQTILFVADAKIVYNEYKSCMAATADSKTIFTMDPDTPEGHILHQFVRSQADQGSNFLSDTSNEQDPDLSTIRTVLTVEQVDQWKCGTSDQEHSVEYAVMYIYITTFNIDDENCSVLKNVCCKCRKELKAEAGFICTNTQCPGGDPLCQDIASPAVEYNISLSVADHSGSLKFCHLQGSAAENVMGLKASDFQSLDIQKKTEIKWLYMLERCKVIIKMKKLSTDFNTKTSFRILSMSKADPQEIMNATSIC